MSVLVKVSIWSQWILIIDSIRFWLKMAMATVKKKKKRILWNGVTWNAWTNANISVNLELMCKRTLNMPRSSIQPVDIKIRRNHVWIESTITWSRCYVMIVCLCVVESNVSAIWKHSFNQRPKYTAWNV